MNRNNSTFPDGVALNNLFSWFTTYTDRWGGVHGPQATYWASSYHMIGAYNMNFYGLVRGLYCKYKRTNVISQAETDLVAQWAEFINNSFVDRYDYFRNCWGESPFVYDGIVQQASMCILLTDAWVITGKKEFRETASRVLASLVRIKGKFFQKSYVVTNQMLRLAEAILRYSDVDPDFLDQTGDFFACLARLLQRNCIGGDSEYRGAFCQSTSNPDLISPYQGKGIVPLIRLYEKFQSQEYAGYLHGLVQFVLDKVLDNEGMLAGSYIVDNVSRKRFGRLINYTPVSHFPLGRSKLVDWIVGQYRVDQRPVWIARSADTLRGLLLYGSLFNCRRASEMAGKGIASLRDYTNANGSVQNTRNFSGKGVRFLTWQDVLGMPRWNSYVFLLYCEVVDDALSLEIGCHQEFNSQLSEGLQLQENSGSVQLFDGHDKPLWSFHKTYNWSNKRCAVPHWCER